MSSNTVNLRYPICRVPKYNTRQTHIDTEYHLLTLGKRYYMPSVRLLHSANIFFLILPPQTFCTVVLQYLLLSVQECTFLSYFTIFHQFILVKWIFGNFLDLNCKCFEYPKKWIKNDILVTESVLRQYAGPDQKFRTLCSRNMSRNAWRKRLKIL